MSTTSSLLSFRRTRRFRGGLSLALTLLTLLAGCSATSVTSAGTDGSGSTTNGTTVAVHLAPCPKAGPLAKGAKKLPNLTLECLSGGPSLPLQHLTGQPTVINLWASWCTPCRDELPAFQQLYTQNNSEIRTIGVATEDSPKSRSVSLADDLKITFPSLVDENGDLMRAMGVRALPATIFVTSDGAVESVYNGTPLTYSTLRQKIFDTLHVQFS